MILKELKVTEKFLTFDNLPSIKFDPKLLIITGPNGYGKTTILELIYQLLTYKDLEEDLKQKIGKVTLSTDQGDITFDQEHGIQRNCIQSYPCIRYKKQDNIETYTLTTFDLITLQNYPEIINWVFLENGLEPIIDLNNGKLLIKHSGLTNAIAFPFEDAPQSLQNLLMMYLFSAQTKPSDILLIDMPEEHLHLSIQRELLKRFSKLCIGQLVVTTHSPSILIPEKHIDLYRLNKNIQNNENRNY